ncbi:hypothetical protein KA005_29845 [bacterium]|nr:hypothetical protein [bacterium]
MNFSPCETTYIAGGFTIIGALAGSFIGYRTALNIYKLSEFNKAAAQFRAAFYPEILSLKDRIGSPETPSTDQSIRDFMQAGYVNRHARAFLLFSAALSKRKANSAEKDWKKYQKNIKNFTSSPMKQEDVDEVLTLLDRFLNKHAPPK